MPSANICGQILTNRNLTTGYCARTVTGQTHEINLHRDAQGLAELDQRVHGPLQHGNQQWVLATIIVTYPRGDLMDFGIDLFSADQLVVNIFLNVSDSHGLHLGTRE